MISTYVSGLIYFMRLERMRRKIENDPQARNYTDHALRPVDDDELGRKLELYNATESARVAADQAMSRWRPVDRIGIEKPAAT